MSYKFAINILKNYSDDACKLISKKTVAAKDTIFSAEKAVTKPLGFVDEVILKTKQTSSNIKCSIDDIVGDSPAWTEFAGFANGKVRLEPISSLLNRQSTRVQKAYKELEKVVIARNPAKNNDPKKLQILANRYLRNSSVQNETTMLAYLERVKILMGKKDPKGEPLLGARFIEYMSNARVNKISPEKYRELSWLVEAAEKGYIPKDMFNTSFYYEFADGVNPKIMKDIERLVEAHRKGIDPIDMFIPSQKKQEIIPTLVKDGEMFENYFGEVFMNAKTRNGDNMSHKIGEMNREQTFKMFHPISRYFISQGQAGSCYQLAAYESMLNSPNITAYLTRRIKVDGNKFIIQMPSHSTPNNIFAGRFKDFSSSGAVRVELDGVKYNPLDKAKTAQSNSLVQALETLYGSHRKYTVAHEYIDQVVKSGGNYKKEFVHMLDNMQNTIITKCSDGKLHRFTLDEFYNYQMDLFKRGLRAREPKHYMVADDYYKESGNITEIYDFFLKGRGNVKKVRIKPGDKLDDYRDMLEHSTAACFSTPSKIGKTDSNFINVDRNLAYQHAYTILNYDRTTDTVTYANPWNTALVYRMTLKDLSKYIDGIGCFDYMY